MLSMNSRRWLPVGAALVIGLLFLLVTITWAQTGPAAVNVPASVPNQIAFQGNVLSGGQPFSGTGRFKFALIDAGGSTAYWSNDGTGIGVSPTMPAGSVVLTVTDGLFNVLLGDTSQAGMSQPLAPGLFSGFARRLRVWFDDGVNGFQQLSPDAPLTSVAFAFNAATLGGVDSSAYVQSAGLSDQVAAAGFLKRSLADTLYAPQVANILLVAPSGGDFTSIQAALNSITEASAQHPYLIEVAPGVYTGSVVMKPYVDIQGSGEGVTTLTAPGSAVASDSTVTGASDAEIRSLTIQNTGGNLFATGVHNVSAALRLRQVTVAVLNAQVAYGLLNESSAPRLADVTIKVWGGSAYGISNNLSLQVIVGSSISVTGITAAYGIYSRVDPSDSQPQSAIVIDHSEIASTGPTVYGELGYTTRIAFSRLAGGPVVGDGTLLCAAVVDENDVFYASSCP